MINLVAMMMVGAGTEEELEVKDPPQEDDEDEEEEGPSVAPGEGEFTGFDQLHFSPVSQRNCSHMESTLLEKFMKRLVNQTPPSLSGFGIQPCR